MSTTDICIASLIDRYTTFVPAAGDHLLTTPAGLTASLGCKTLGARGHELAMSGLMRGIPRVLARGIRYWAALLAGPRARPRQQYRVLVDDNYDPDPSACWEQGRYDSLEEAIAACKRMVDGCLEGYYKPGMPAEELQKAYHQFGDDPFIVGGDRGTFSAWDYAAARAKEMCEGR